MTSPYIEEAMRRRGLGINVEVAMWYGPIYGWEINWWRRYHRTWLRGDHTQDLETAKKIYLQAVEELSR